MGRAHGKRTGRTPRITADSPEGHQLGIGQLYDHPLPGGQNHLANAPVKHEQPPVPGQRGEEFEGWLAHGVPPADHGVYDRADLPGNRRGRYDPVYKKQPDPVTPVPVVVVERARDMQTLRTAFVDRITVPSGVIEPVRLCSNDPERVHVQFLNETASGSGITGVRFGTLEQVQTGLGALLPAGMTSYLRLGTQAELFALPNDANTYVISVILETEIQGD